MLSIIILLTILFLSYIFFTIKYKPNLFLKSLLYITNIGLELLYRLFAWYCFAGLLCCCDHGFHAGGWSFL